VSALTHYFLSETPLFGILWAAALAFDNDISS
jgi:hypothetical protein